MYGMAMVRTTMQESLWKTLPRNIKRWFWCSMRDTGMSITAVLEPTITFQVPGQR